MDARDAVSELDGVELKGQRVRLELSNGGRDRRRGQRSSERILERDDRRGGDRRQRRRRSGSKGTYYEKTAYKKYGQPNKTPWMIEIDNLSERVR